jgi:isopentenyl phosphate kinase
MKILKLGGSVVTRKDKTMTPNLENIHRLSREIGNTDAELVLIHGGGSYGHPLAKKYDIVQGHKGFEQLIGFSETHQAMLKLNGLIVENLLNAGQPGISMSPNSFIITDGGRIKKINTSLIERYLDLGMLPVLFGDTVLDKSLEFTILSGDQLAVKLAESLRADKIIFGIDVEGIYTTDPKITRGARLIEEISIEELREEAEISGTQTTDVTGGMKGKIDESLHVLGKNIEVQFVNANVPGRVAGALEGRKVTGTILR